MTELGDRGLLRLRLAAGSALLLGLAFLQAPGLLVADTKFDLAVAPDGFLARALQLWDAEGAFGQLQNQAYGYLWPMGSFFWLGDAVGLPGWVVQRLWLAVVLVVAFLGAALLVRALGVRSHLAVLLAGFAYATSPRMLSTLGPISIEAWPSAVAPWVLLALVVGATRGSPRRAALLAGFAVAMVGGVNATATFAVIPLGVVWVLTRTPGPRRRALMLWWPVFTVLGTLWWLVPLFLLGAYSPPFLDYIETASVTTFPTTLFDALRGSSAWVPYVDPSWRGGHLVVTEFYLVLNSGLVLALGVYGLLVARRDRLFLALGLAAGLFLVTMGHTGAVAGWFADPLASLLDGVLAPARNVHKFDPVIRIPLVVGLAWAVESVVRAAVQRPADDPEAAVDRAGPQGLSAVQRIGVVGVVGVLGASLPLVTADVTPSRPVVEIPGYWQETAAWLADDAARASADGEEAGVALLAPGSSFGSYLWGTPRDEPLQVLADNPWAVRNAIPLAPEGNIRMLDAVEARLATGHGSPGLAAYLARAGVGTVVVRNDLVPGGDVPDAALVHQAIEESPGLSLAATFGPEVGNDARAEVEGRRVLIEDGWSRPRPAVEVYRVEGRATSADLAPEDREALPVVVGGPEDLLDLLDAELLDGTPTRLGFDAAADSARPPTGSVVLTDGLLDRERFFGRVHDGYGAVTTPGDVARTGNPTADYLPVGADAWTTRAVLDGARSVAASSSLSDANAPGGAQPAHLPYAAVDGDPTTSWVSRPAADGTTTWWRLDLEEPRTVRRVTLTAVADGAERTRVRVVTDAGVSDEVDLERGTTLTVEVPGDVPTDSVRVETSDSVLALADVAVPGVRVSRSLLLPELPAAWPVADAVVLRALRDARTGCVQVDGAVPCAVGRARAAEEAGIVRRTVPVSAPVSYDWSLTATPRSGAQLDALLQRDLGFAATASSHGVPDPRAGAVAAVDGDPLTAWVADGDDVRPTLTLRWLGARPVQRLALGVADDLPIAAPTRVRVAWTGGFEDVDVADDGTVTLEAPVTTDGLEVQIIRSTATGSVATDGTVVPLPVGLSEVRVVGQEDLGIRLGGQVETAACGTGPVVRIDGTAVRTALRGSRRDLYAGDGVAVVPCDGDSSVRWAAGEHQVDLVASDVSAPTTFVALRAGSTLAGSDADLEPAPGGTTRRDVDRAGVLVLRQNVNPGWRATQDGDLLEPVVLDGWQQGFVVPAEGVVRLDFTPQRPYLSGLVAGGVVWLLVVLLALVPAPGRGGAGPRRTARWRGRLWGRSDAPALGEVRVPAGVLVPVAAVVGGTLGGWPGALLAGVAGLVTSRAVLRVPASRRGAGAVAGLLVVTAAMGYVVRPWTSPEGWAGEWAWPHYLVLAVLGVLLAAAGRERTSRWTGSSTQR